MAANIEAQLDGAWAESDENCKNAFIVKGGKWDFREPRAMVGSSLQDGDTRGRSAFAISRR